MPTYHPLRELIVARLREFFREPEAIFWVYVFPLALALGLGLAFLDDPKVSIHVGVVAVDDSRGVSDLIAALQTEAGFHAREVDETGGRYDLAKGRLDILVVRERTPDPQTEGLRFRFIYDPSRPSSALAREAVNSALQIAAGRSDPVATADVEVREPGSRYIDFLFPGLIGMNLMGGGLYGIGFVIVDMRVRKLLKRFRATPMRGSHFFLAMLGARLVFLVPEMIFLLSIAILGFGVPMKGNYLDLIAAVLLASLSFCGIGLLIASRARKLETISGLMNLAMLPMWLLGGIFFSAERFPDAFQPIIQALPLTATNDILRAILLDGQSILDRGAEVLTLVAWGGLGFLLSLKMFRWI